MNYVLLVDDHPSLRQALSILLETEGYSVLTAGSGATALRELETHTVDVLITDINMPGMSGITLTTEVRRRFPEVFIIVSSFDVEQGVLALDAGAHLFLAKPYANTELLEAIESLSRSTRE